MATTNWTAMNNIGDFLAEANNQTSGYFWGGINFMIFLVVLITLAGTAGWEAAILAASFVAVLSGLFMVYLGLMAMWMLGMYIGLLLIVIIYLMWSNRYD